MSLAIVCAGTGNILIRKGMVIIGPLENYQWIPLFHFFVSALSSQWILFGILLELTYFFLFLAVLSWADVSWTLPMHAVEYIYVAFVALFFLGENLEWTRWVGILLIASGIIFMMRSWNRESKVKKEGDLKELPKKLS